MATKREYQNKGYGKKVMEHFVEYVSQLGFHDIELYAWSEKTKPICALTQAFYKSVGFVVTQEHMGLWGQDMITVKMKKSWGNRERSAMSIIYTNAISVEDYNALRLSAGWSAIEPEQAQAGLAGSAFITAAKDGDKTVGVGRLVWDGGYAALIKDVLVLPEYQGMGIGTAMMEQIFSFLIEGIKPGWGVSVDLMAAIGKEGFYEKFGFVSRPRENRGAGMDIWIVKK